MCFAEIVAWQPPDAGSRPVPIGSRRIGVSLQPAIPRRVAPQQSPLPLHRSPRIVTESRSGEAIKCAARLSLPGCSPGRARRARRQQGCHFYFAQQVTFLPCADKILGSRPRPLVSLKQPWSVFFPPPACATDQAVF